MACCWAEAERNPFVSPLMKVLANADPARLTGEIRSAGFRDVQIEEMEIDVVEVDSGETYWEAMSDLAGPVMVLVNQLDGRSREPFISEGIDAANRFLAGNSLRMRGTTWIASGIR